MLEKNDSITLPIVTSSSLAIIFFLVQLYEYKAYYEIEKDDINLYIDLLHKKIRINRFKIGDLTSTVKDPKFNYFILFYFILFYFIFWYKYEKISFRFY